MGRFAWYAGASTALAAGVVVSAFDQRANFYSACVYLSQSNLCLMILINLVLLIYGSFMYGLQRLCYGALRPIETEQLYEKAWFAITETCLAMTIFRDEVGAWFLVMFVALITGKVWGWIGDGRVEVLEQQPPANPRLFHIRLSGSLAMSVIFDIWIMSYIINTVIQQARPNMMVMFLFEFAILTACSFATAFRYSISLIEAKVVKKQTTQRLAERRREVREERADQIRQRAAAEEGGEAVNSTPLPSEDDVDEMDIEVPGWEAKGHWVLTLDLISDFIKLCIYVTFFVILLMFYGLPIHIMRDVFMTARSFAKRLAAFLRYRRATHDMNTRYEDATAEDIQREDTCIICREEMRPWSVTNPPPAAGAAPRPGAVNERSRPKKLPCGHILHLGCLKSWLERQQACPTCRRSVVDAPRPTNANPAEPVPQRPDQPAARGGGMRMLNLGPLRVGFGQANLQDIAPGLAQAGQDPPARARVYGIQLGIPRRQVQQPQPHVQPQVPTSNAMHAHLQQLEQAIVSDIRSLQMTQQELQLVQLLQAELARLRLLQTGAIDPLPGGGGLQMPQISQNGPFTRPPMPIQIPIPPQVQVHGVTPATSAIPAGSADLPPGLTIPDGWSLLPLQRMDGQGPLPTATTTAAPGPNLSPMDTSNIIHAHAHSPISRVESRIQETGIHSSVVNTMNHHQSAEASQSAASTEGTVEQASSRGDPVMGTTSIEELFAEGQTIQDSNALASTSASGSLTRGLSAKDKSEDHHSGDKGKRKAVELEDEADEAGGM